MKYSVLVTVYNDEDYLPQCFDSILSQTVKAEEIVVVNDNSTDGTGAVIDEYGFDHVFSSEPKHETRWLNRVRAFKLGLESLTKPTDLVLKVDADITMDHNYTATLIKHYLPNPHLVACSGIANVNQFHSLPRNGAILYRRSIINKSSEINEVYAWDRWILLWLLENGYALHVDETVQYKELRDSVLTLNEAYSAGTVRRQERYPLIGVLRQAILQKGWKSLAFLNGYLRGNGLERHDPEFIRQYSKKEEAQRICYINNRLRIKK